MTWLDFFYFMNLVFCGATIYSALRGEYSQACLFSILMASNQISILSEQLQPLIHK